MKLTGSRNQCQSCKQYFNSNGAFEKHRTGKHGVNRRCCTTEEMLAKGMSINGYGFWIAEKFEKEKYERLQKDLNKEKT